MNDAFLLQPIKNEKSVGDNPHLQQLQLLTNQMNENMKHSPSAATLLNSNLSSTVHTSSTSSSSTTGSTSIPQVTSISSLSNPNSISSSSNSVKDEDRKLVKDNLTNDPSSGNLINNHNSLITCTTSSTTNAMIASLPSIHNSIHNSIHSSLNSSLHNSIHNSLHNSMDSSINGSKLQPSLIEHSLLNVSTNSLIADSVRISNQATNDYFIHQYGEDNQIASNDLLNYEYSFKANYHPLSPPASNNGESTTFHNLTSNQLTTNYNGQANSFLNINSFNSVNSINLNCSNPLLNLQSHSLSLADDNLGAGAVSYENSLNLSGSLQLPSLTGASNANGFNTFHNLQNLDPLTVQTTTGNGGQLDGNHLNQSTNGTQPALVSSMNSVNLNSISNGNYNASTTNSSTATTNSSLFTAEQIRGMIETLLRGGDFLKLNNLLRSFAINPTYGSNDKKTSNGGSIDTNGQENSLTSSVQFPNLINSSTDLAYRSNYSNGQFNALNTITSNVYNNMHSICNASLSNGNLASQTAHQPSNQSHSQTNGNQQTNQQPQTDSPSSSSVQTAADVFLIDQLPFDKRTNEFIMIARAHIEFNKFAFKNLYRIIEENEFSAEFHNVLQKLWHESLYKECERSRKRPLCAVDKYRVRKKHHFPRTIWDGEEYIYCFKESSRQTLKDCYASNK